MAGAAEEDTSFDGRAYARTLTQGPGVYRMIAVDEAVLYVGKARNLRKRVESYFARGAHDARITSMVAQVARIEVIVTRTEAEALLLESQLIKALKPRYNIDLRDDKSYPWIHLAHEHAYPRIEFHRGARSGKGRYFGPYPSAWAVRQTLNLVHRAFKLRQCEDSVFQNRSRPCLQHQIQRCSAPCVGLISTEQYAQSVTDAETFLDGRSQHLLEQLQLRMSHAAEELDFERAAALRDQIAALRKVTAEQFVQGERGDLDVVAVATRNGKACIQALFFRGGMSLGNRSFFPRYVGDPEPSEILRAFLVQHYTTHTPPSELLLSEEIEDLDAIAEALSDQRGSRVRLVCKPRGERAQWLEMARRTADAALESELAAASTMLQRRLDLARLLELPAPPERIECFDISHTQGEATVASCVVFDAQGAVKTDYRRFNIEGITPGDDYAAMRQALERRFTRLARGEGKRPDLLLIDGGRGQLAEARSILQGLGLADLNVVGVAKGPERRPGHESLIMGRDGRELWPGPASPGLHLIQQVRDEAHRFAITGHRARRGKQRVQSTLDEIDGIGARRKSALLKAFGGLRGVAAAGVEELLTVPGIHRELAERIYAQFHGDR